MGQRTGAFTLPPLRFSFLNPRTGRYETSQTSALALEVKAAREGAPMGPAADPGLSASAKNVLSAGVLRPVRHQATFAAPSAPPWQRLGFVLLLTAPVAAWLAAVLADRFRGRAARESPEAAQRRKAKETRERLARARGLLQAQPDAFYTEVERAVLSSLELKLGAPVGGLTRVELIKRLTEAGFPEQRRQALVSVLEACEVGRYAPGGGGAGRERVLADAATVIAGGPG
jgi:hypothetical protein